MTSPSQPSSVGRGVVPRMDFFTEAETLPAKSDNPPRATTSNALPSEPPITDGGKPLNKGTKPDNSRQVSIIEQAKDRAQITASTAMSVVQVALLKDLLDAGSYGNKYYYWSLGFILTAIILQVISGFVAIYIALLRYYYSEYKDDFLDDCCKTMCPFRLRRKPNAVTSSPDSWMNTSSSLNRRAMKPQTRQPKSFDPENMDDLTGLDAEPDADEVGCCSQYDCTTMRFADYEYEVLALYDNMHEQVVKADLKAAKFDVELVWLKEKVNQLRDELQKYEAGDSTNETAEKEQLQKIKDQIREAQVKKGELDDKRRRARRTRVQASVLEHHVEIIQEERVLKRATFWQNLLNMMLYTVFILNVLIDGIGLANPKFPPATAVAGANATVG